MNENNRRKLSWFIILALLGLAVWQITAGKEDFGLGLIAGIVGVSIIRIIKQKQIKELRKQGLNPYDERAYAISYRASYSTLVLIIIFSALFVLVGSILGPEITVNPYNFLGICLALMVFIYTLYYYYYNRQM